MSWMADGVGRIIARYLEKPEQGYEEIAPGDAEALRATLRPGDVLLVEGNNHISGVIKYLTQSTWSHAALYVGPIGDRVSAEGEPLELVEACCADLLSTGQRPNWLTNFVSDHVLTPNEKVHFLVLIDSEANLPYWKRLDSARNKVVLQACYCSVLDDCWMLDSSRNQPEPIAACPAKQATDYQG